MYIAIKPCGFCFQGFHCNDVAITCKHSYHPFCLGELLRDNNNCSICRQVLHLDWMQSWGVHKEDVVIKKLATDMEIESLWKEMKLSLLEATSINLSRYESSMNLLLFKKMIFATICISK